MPIACITDAQDSSRPDAVVVRFQVNRRKEKFFKELVSDLLDRSSQPAGARNPGRIGNGCGA
ncbi:hypothetical protein D3870_03175 [Noviherbaspirillum cavernae]|uniref:Uncharacterized protein n=1 Tax=Noviherbaspirillum cavernae TaxID=2320862 RepID=A0A418WY74_9BURK|nr:hypothetical protein D3870_03175 [Noviherbaspirillum cavernae]